MGRIDAAVTANPMYISREREAIPCNKKPASFGYNGFLGVFTDEFENSRKV